MLLTKKNGQLVAIAPTTKASGSQPRFKDISPITANGTYKVFDNLIEIESIKGNGSAYFPTEITLADSTTINERYEIECCLVAGGSGSGYVYGCKGTGTYMSYFYMFDYGTSGVQILNGYYDFYPSYTRTVGTEIVYRTEGQYLYINGVQKNYQLTAKYFTDPTTLYIFAYNNGSTPNNIFHDSLFKYLKIKGSDGALLYHFVPARTADGTPKILEKVNGVVYDAVGSTTGMTLGADVEDWRYDGFKAPIEVNVPKQTKWGATFDDMFLLQTPSTPTLHDVVIPTNEFNKPMAELFRYSTIKSLTAYGPASTLASAYRYIVGNAPNLESVAFRRVSSGSYIYANGLEYAFYGSSIKHFYNDLFVFSTNSYLLQYAFYGCTQLEDFVFEQVGNVNGSNTFNQTFRGCSNLTKVLITNNNVSTWGIGTSSGTNIFNYAFRGCDKLYDEDINHIQFPTLKQIGYNSGTSYYGGLRYAFYTDDSTKYGKLHLILPELSWIYNRNSTVTNGHFAYCNALGKIYLPKFVADGTTGKNIFNNCLYLTEIHFGIENQATVSALAGYSSNFGATNATIYFDMPNHITVNGTVYDRDGFNYDYDTSHYSWKNGTSVIYTTNAINPAVGDTVYTKSGDAYTAGGTITAVS